ncbi:hypothetical protein ACROYT_G004348 [Oculina patagonica]
MSYKEANEVLNYWFGGGDRSKRPRWFEGGEEAAQEIRDKFGALVEKARNDELKHWENDPKATLALILLQDQFLRSLYKGTPAAYSRDPYCLELSRKFIQRETHDHLKFSPAARAFIYLPFEHSENRDDQELGLQLFAQIEKDTVGSEEEAFWKKFHQFAGLHKEVVDKFGRFPQRNKFLGRDNTPEEEEWLDNLPDRYKW